MQKLTIESRLTKESLEELRAMGFTYILIKTYSPDWRGDYIGLNYLTLQPVKELPQGEGEKEIYESIESKILEDWAALPEDGICAFIEGYPFDQK